MSLASILFLLSFTFNLGTVPGDSLTDKSLQNMGSPIAIENKISYEKGILRNKLDYQLLHGKKGKFILKFTNKPNQNLDVRIYDVIGNLIQTDKFLQEEGNEKEYDFSNRETKIYVVKVSFDEENVVKKINI
ncbi:MAG: T9SS type A sorting domain-containing protein [Cyclobacteriaceae bacterium]